MDGIQGGVMKLTVGNGGYWDWKGCYVMHTKLEYDEECLYSSVD